MTIKKLGKTSKLIDDLDKNGSDWVLFIFYLNIKFYSKKSFSW
jgi:hypothetical protein